MEPPRFISGDAQPMTATSTLSEWTVRHGKPKSVARTDCSDPATGELVIVSTVLLGFAMSMVGPDAWSYETRIFGGRYDQEHWSYASRQEAEEGHRRAVALVRESI